MGDRLRTARLRRRMSLSEMAERVGVTRVTLRSLEDGSPGVSFGVLVRALAVLGLEGDLAAIAADDELGRQLVDSELKTPRRSSR
jgi:transcriptional regulator with XRE-family HTH domain